MHFTREPIIETVITPREGCKLVVRSSKGANQEEFFVDAVEVVSFGHSFFYRSLDRPKSFLVPVSDYEILELKEARMALKSATSERSTKIGGGREAPMRPREPEREEISEQRGVERGPDRKRDKRRRGRRTRDRDRNESQEMPNETYEEAPFEANEGLPAPVEPGAHSEEQKTPSFISKLFPPPPTLIKETLSRYKPAETAEEDLFPASSEEPVAFDEKTSFEESIYEPPTHPESGESDDTEE